jgi:hypothetical protein
MSDTNDANSKRSTTVQYKGSWGGDKLDPGEINRRSFLLLMRQLDWIGKRTECVSFDDTGATRHRITVEYSIDDNLRLPWTFGGETYYGIPALFTSRADLSALRCEYYDGTDLTVCDRSSSYHLFKNALEYGWKEFCECAKQLEKSKQSESSKSAVWTKLVERIDSFEEKVKLNEGWYTAKKYTFMMQSVCFSKNDNPDNPNNESNNGDTKEYGKRLRRNRRKFFIHLLDILNRNVGSDGCGTFEVDDGHITAENLMPYSCFTQLEKICIELAEYEDCENVIEKLRQYLLLLSTSNETNLLVALVPQRSFIPHASLTVEFETSFKEAERDRWVPWRNNVDMIVQTGAAHSTCVEIESLPGMDIAYIEETRPTNIRHAEGPGETSMSDQPEAGDDEWYGENRRLRCRPLSGNAYITTDVLTRDKSHSRPFPRAFLKITFLPRWGFLLSILGWSCAMAVFTIMALLSLLQPASSSIAQLRNPGTSAAVIAIIFTLWVARNIGSSSHALVRTLTGYSNTLLLLSLFSTSFAYMWLAFGADGQQVKTRDVVLIVIALIVNGIVVLIALAGVCCRLQYCGFGKRDKRDKRDAVCKPKAFDTFKPWKRLKEVNSHSLLRGGDVVRIPVGNPSPHAQAEREGLAGADFEAPSEGGSFTILESQSGEQQLDFYCALENYK